MRHMERAPINPITRAVWRLVNRGLDRFTICAICDLTPAELYAQIKKLCRWKYEVQA